MVTQKGAVANLKTAVNSALIRSDRRTQLLVYYTSGALYCMELNYPIMEKLAYTLLITSRKLVIHFHAHVIDVFTD